MIPNKIPPEKFTQSRNFPQRSRMFCSHSILLFIAPYLISAIILVQGAQDDRFLPTNLNSPQNCSPKSRNCLTSKPQPFYVPGTPRVSDKKNQSDSLVQFITWLFGTPNTSSKNSTLPDQNNSTNKLEQSNNQIPTYENVSENTSKTVVYSVPFSDNAKALSTERKTTRKLDKDSSAVLDLHESGGTQVGTSEITFDNDAESASQDKENLRHRRDSYKPIKVPYTKSSDKKPITLNDAFQRRQLLLSPFEQQQQQAMIAIQAQQQQQAAAAAAAMLQQHQIFNEKRYAAALLDDYDDRDDDDDSDEDSDELDDFPHFGFPPTVEHHHMYFRKDADAPTMTMEGRQRREGVPVRAKGNKKGRRKSNASHGTMERKNRVSKLKSGHWFLDDYDLLSDFYDRPHGRFDLPNGFRENDKMFDRIELDEQGHYNRHYALQNGKGNEESKESHSRNGSETKFRDSMCSDNECPTQRQAEGESPSDTTTEAEPSSSADGTDAGSTSESSTTSSSSTTETSDTFESSSVGSEDPLSPGLSSTTIAGPDLSSTLGAMDLNSTTEISVPSSTLGISNDTSSTTMEAETGMTTTDTPTTSTQSSNSTEGPQPIPPYKANLNCKCGTQSVRGAGIGDGHVVRFHVNPWLVEIASTNSTGSHLCSGSIINDRFVLTTKSCVQNASSPGNLRVVAGLQSKQSKNFAVKNIISNPKVNLALLQLSTPIKPNSVMRPVCLPIGKRYAGNYSSGNLVTFKKSSGRTPYLQMVDTEVGILSDSDCEANGQGEGMVCTGPPGSAKCGGDTGGVLQVYRGGYSYEQIAVVADTVGCRPKNMTGVYTDIRKRTRWILNKAKDGNYCRNPKVTEEDLSSSTRFGDPVFELKDDDLSKESDERKEDYDSDEDSNVNKEQTGEEELDDDVSNEEDE